MYINNTHTHILILTAPLKNGNRMFDKSQFER